MAEIKVSLNIKLPGRVLLSQESADALEKQNLQGYSVHKMVVEWGKGKKDLINIKTRNCVPAVQSINISKEAYEYMTAKDKKKERDGINCPSFSTPQKWFPLSRKERLEAHLREIAASRGGVLMNYQVFED